MLGKFSGPLDNIPPADASIKAKNPFEETGERISLKSTVGFTIQDFSDFLEDAFGNSSILALIIEAKGHNQISNFTAYTIELTQNNGGDLVISKNAAVLASGFQNVLEFSQLGRPLNSGVIGANLPGQVSFDPDSPEAKCLPKTELKSTTQKDALEKFQPRIEGIYFGRGDLMLMHALKDHYPDKDWFFSGAEIDFSTMHDSALQVERFSYSGVPDASICFTLKAEMVPSAVLEEGSNTGNADAGTGNSSFTGTGEQMVPSAFLGMPCPSFWDTVPAFVPEAEGAIYELALNRFLRDGTVVASVKNIKGEVERTRKLIAAELADKQYADLDQQIIISNNV